MLRNRIVATREDNSKLFHRAHSGSFCFLFSFFPVILWSCTEYSSWSRSLDLNNSHMVDIVNNICSYLCQFLKISRIILSTNDVVFLSNLNEPGKKYLGQKLGWHVHTFPIKCMWTLANEHCVCSFINLAFSRTGQYRYDVKPRLSACDLKLCAVISNWALAWFVCHLCHIKKCIFLSTANFLRTRCLVSDKKRWEARA